MAGAPLSQDGLVLRGVDRFAPHMPRGGVSPLLAANASKYPVAGQSYVAPGTPTVDGLCALGTLADMVNIGMQYGVGNTFQDTMLYGMLDSMLVKPSELTPPVTRLDGYVRVADLRNIGELSAAMVSYKDVQTLYDVAISMSVIPKEKVDSLTSALKATIMGKASSLSKDDQLALSDELDSVGACPSGARVETVESSTEVVALGGAGALNDTQVVTRDNNLQPVDVGWGGFRSKPLSFNTYVELVDRYGTSVSLQKADDTVLTGLALNMSPETLTVNSVNIINRSQTLASWVEEHWGEDIDQVSFSGKSLGLIVESSDMKYLATDTRMNSPAYQEMKSLVSIYQSNGLVIQGASVGDTSRPAREFYSPTSMTPVRRILAHPRTGLVQERLYIRITFDFLQCIGYFESFELVEDADTPYLFNYSVNFKSELTVYG